MRIVGVIHLLPLPGSPLHGGDLEAVIGRAVRDARAYERGGADGVIVENYGDAPFFKEALPPECVAAFTRCAAAVRAAVKVPMGINALRNDARAALGIAVAAGGAFIRINVHAGVVATDQGLIEGRAAETLRLRAALGARTAIFADACVKHGRPLFPEDAVRASQDLLARAGADAVILTGSATGVATDVELLARVREAIPGARIYVGSGVTAETVAETLRHADGVIVGTALKRDGETAAEVDPARVRAFRKAASRAAPRSR